MSSSGIRRVILILRYLKLWQTLFLAGILTLLCAYSVRAQGRWIPKGPWGGSVNAFAIDPLTPNTLYAGLSSRGPFFSGTLGLFRSMDGADTWTPISINLANIWALAIDPLAPSTVYAGTHGSGMFRSTNGGNTRVASNSGLTHLSVLESQLNSLKAAGIYQEAFLRLAEHLEDFLARLRRNGDSSSATDRQRILRLVVKEILVGEDTITIKHSIPLSSSGTVSTPLTPQKTPGYLLRSGRQ